MNDSIGKALIILSIIIGFIVGNLFSSTIHGNEYSFYKEHQQLIQECQAKLPRDKFCKLIAVDDK